MSIPITFWSTPECTQLLSSACNITGLSRSKLIHLLIDTHLDSLIASFCANGLELEAESIKLRSKLSNIQGNSKTNTRFGISLKDNNTSK